MKNIAKAAELPSLTEWRAQNPTDYENYPDKDALRVALSSEQRGICCYCMQRIRPQRDSMKIEHWKSHRNYPQLRLVYSNLLGACIGGEGYRKKDQHCDTFKGDADLCRNPADATHNIEIRIRYLSDGTIEATDQLFNEHLNTVLNLNLPFLKANRKAVLDGFKRFLGLRAGKIKPEIWQKLLQQWDGDGHAGELEEYAGVVSYWIRKHLR